MKKLIKFTFVILTFLALSVSIFATTSWDDFKNFTFIGDDTLSMSDIEIDMLNNEIKIIRQELGINMVFLLKDTTGIHAELSMEEYIDVYIDNGVLDDFLAQDTLFFFLDFTENGLNHYATYSGDALDIITEDFQTNYNETIIKYNNSNDYVGIIHSIMMDLTQSLDTDSFRVLLDYGNYLTDEEEKEIEAGIKYIKDTYNFDLTFAIFTDVGASDDLLETLAQFNNDFPLINEDRDGAVCIISMDEWNYGYSRGYDTSTRNGGIGYFSSYALDNVDSIAAEHLAAGEYYEFFMQYINITENAIIAYNSGEAYEVPFYVSSTELMVVLGMAALFGLIGMFAYRKTLINQMNTAVAKEHAQHYVTPGSFKINHRKDRFLYENTVRTKKVQSSSSSSGGGSRGFSSSGSSRGGRGGRF